MALQRIVFALIHSPLVGTTTWAAVAEQLSHEGFVTVTPALASPQTPEPPFWSTHVHNVAVALKPFSSDPVVILAGHSGGGVLLPAISQSLDKPAGAAIFIDAAIPRDGASRLDLFESSEAAEEFRRAASNGLLPTWSEEDLRGVIEDDELRHKFVSELRPLPLAVYEEPLPVSEGWADVPQAYLHFTSTYDLFAKQAQQAGWPYIHLEGGHFHMLVDPIAVAGALIDGLGQLGINM